MAPFCVLPNFGNLTTSIYAIFTGDTLHEVFDCIQAGNIDYASEHWDYISDGAKECLKEMLAYRSSKRSEADTLLQNKWINEAPEAPMDTSVTSRFKAFGGMNKLQQVSTDTVNFRH